MSNPNTPEADGAGRDIVERLLADIAQTRVQCWDQSIGKDGAAAIKPVITAYFSTLTQERDAFQNGLEIIAENSPDEIAVDLCRKLLRSATP